MEIKTEVRIKMSFGEALELLKKNSKVCRIGWNGKDMYLKLVEGYPVDGHLNANDVNSTVVGKTQGKSGQMLPHIVMKTAGDSKYWGVGYSDYVPWLASQTDILADDWMEVE